MTLGPPRLPPYIFLLSDHTTRELACEIAEALSERYPAVYVDDFLAPIHEAFTAMFELDWKRDMGQPSELNKLFIPAGDETENDIIVALEAWFTDKFGPHVLGKMAAARSAARNAMADYITIFRDATPAHLVGFNPPPHIDRIAITLTRDSTVESVLSQLGG